MLREEMIQKRAGRDGDDFQKKTNTKNVEKNSVNTEYCGRRCCLKK